MMRHHITPNAAGIFAIGSIVVVFAMPWFYPTIVIARLLLDSIPNSVALLITLIIAVGNGWVVYKLFQLLPNKFIGALGALQLAFFSYYIFGEMEGKIWVILIMLVGAVLGFYLFRWIAHFSKRFIKQNA